MRKEIVKREWRNDEVSFFRTLSLLVAESKVLICQRDSVSQSSLDGSPKKKKPIFIIANFTWFYYSLNKLQRSRSSLNEARRKKSRDNHKITQNKKEQKNYLKMPKRPTDNYKLTQNTKFMSMQGWKGKSLITFVMFGSAPEGKRKIWQLAEVRMCWERFPIVKAHLEDEAFKTFSLRIYEISALQHKKFLWC